MSSGNTPSSTTFERVKLLTQTTRSAARTVNFLLNLTGGSWENSDPWANRMSGILRTLEARTALGPARGLQRSQMR